MLANVQRSQRRLQPWTLFVAIILIGTICLLFPSAVLADPEYTITVEPTSANGPVGAEHTLTATALYGDPAPEKCDVEFEILDGPHSGGSPARFENVGEDPVTFSYTGSEVGTDTIRVTYTCMATEQLPFRPPVEIYVDRFTDVTKEWLPPTLEEITADVTPDAICFDLKRRKRVWCIDPEKLEKLREIPRWKRRKIVRRLLHRLNRRYYRNLRLLMKSSEDLDVRDIEQSTCRLEHPDNGNKAVPKRIRLKDKDRDDVDDHLIQIFDNKQLLNKVVDAHCTMLVLAGEMTDGRSFSANVPVRIVDTEKIRRELRKMYREKRRNRWKRCWKRRWTYNSQDKDD